MRVPAILLQLVAIVGSVLVLVAAPPRTGRILLLPLSGRAARAMLPLAISRGALLVGAGPLPGSFVVTGDRASLAPSLLAHGVALLVAPAGGCGG